MVRICDWFQQVLAGCINDIIYSWTQGCSRWCCDCQRSWRTCLWSVSDAHYLSFLPQLDWGDIRWVGNSPVTLFFKMQEQCLSKVKLPRSLSSDTHKSVICACIKSMILKIKICSDFFENIMSLLKFSCLLFCIRSGKDFDITSQRVAASNPLLKDAFVEVLQQSEWESNYYNQGNHILVVQDNLVSLLIVSI